MASATSFGDSNAGFQVGHNYGHITAHFLQSESSLNQACLRDLRTTNPQDDKARIQDTNGGLLRESYAWIFENPEFKKWHDNQSHRLLWIKGDPGKGKTMLVCGIIEELRRSVKINTSFFFCQAADVRLNNASAVLRGLAYSLIENQPTLVSHVRSRYDRAGKRLFEDVNAWKALSRIFTDILKDPELGSTCFIIDALDECTTGLYLLLDLLIHESSKHPRVKWIVSSRSWPSIEERLNTATQLVLISLELNEITVSEAVRKFIGHRVDQLAKAKRYTNKTRDEVHRYLLSHSQGTFLWVAMVCQELNRTPRHALGKLELFPSGLNALYGRMIDHICHADDAALCKRILALVSTVYRPLTLDEMTSILGISNQIVDDDEALYKIIGTCGSFLTLRGTTITFIHQSAQEYLLREKPNEVFPDGIEGQHHATFSRSFQVMFKTLRRDIYNIDSPGKPSNGFRKPDPDPLATAKYACVHWVDHLQSCLHQSHDCYLDVEGCIDSFLQQRYLQWIEALSVIGSLHQGIAAMLKLDALLQKNSESKQLLHRVRDACRFIQYHRRAIESAPLQVYCSSLIFSPLQSITRICYEKQRPDWILNQPMVENNWSPCLQTFEEHMDCVHLIAWSQGGTHLASASLDNTVRIWDPLTGQCEINIRHSHLVKSIGWSQDGTRLASASDTSVKIWDSATGQCTSVLEGHGKWIESIAWSPDGTRLASASGDNTVKIWDPTTGRCASTLEGHSRWVDSIAWSQDGTRLASVSDDKTVRIWDPATGQCSSTLKGHTQWIQLVSWSPNGARLASASRTYVRIWDALTGQCEITIPRDSISADSVAWSKDGTRLASVSGASVKIWDPTTGQCSSTLKGHTGWIESITWSPDGSCIASASHDKTIRIWDSATGQCTSVLKGHTESIRSIVWSPDGSRLASASNDKTLRLWDPASSLCALSLEEQSDWVMIQEQGPGQYITSTEGHNCPITMVSWSGDGSRLASASEDGTIWLWDPATGKCNLIFFGHYSSVDSIAWSEDGTRIASGSDDKTVRIWDPSTGHCTLVLEGHSGPIRSVSWSQDGTRLASSSDDRTVRVWDPFSGQCASQLTLDTFYGPVTSIAWSQDGTRLALGPIDKAVGIWELNTSMCERILRWGAGTVGSIAWSPDGTRLASGPHDKTVVIWDPATRCPKLTLPINSPSILRFNKGDLNHLQTTFGTFDISPAGSVRFTRHSLKSLPERYGYGLNDDYSWITYNGVNLLWLPTEYRPACPSLFDISGTRLAIGCSSGRVIFLVLSRI